MITPEQYAQSNTEHSHAVAAMMWCSHAVKLEPRLEWLHAIPNGGLRDKRTAASLKAEGVKAGVSDYFLPVVVYQRFEIHRNGLYIELKRIKTEHKRSGVEGNAQEKFRNAMNERGYKAVVCYGWYHMVTELCNYLSVDILKLDEYVAAQYAKVSKGK